MKMTDFLQFLSSNCGVTDLQVCDLSVCAKDERQATILNFVARVLADESGRKAQRIASLSRALATLRDTHMKTQTAFERLERFVVSNNLAKRTLTSAIVPSDATGSISLSENETLTQRLSIASTGISDIGLFIKDLRAEPDSVLTVVLETDEDGAIKAQWQVPASRLPNGQIRLALPVSLDAEALTPVIRIGWQGPGWVHLKCALFHPDPRYQVKGSTATNSRVLAHNCWTYLPGCEAALAAGSILATNTKEMTPKRAVIDRETLVKSINLNLENKHFRYLEEVDGLLVHVLSDKVVAAALIPDALPPGTTSVTTSIQTLKLQSADISYAIAAAPVASRVKPNSGLPRFESWARSEWVTMKPLEPGQIHLPFSRASEDSLDLYLMVKLPDGTKDTSWGWSVFSGVSISLGGA